MFCHWWGGIWRGLSILYLYNFRGHTVNISRVRVTHCSSSPPALSFRLCTSVLNSFFFCCLASSSTSTFSVFFFFFLVSVCVRRRWRWCSALFSCNLFYESLNRLQVCNSIRNNIYSYRSKASRFSIVFLCVAFIFFFIFLFYFGFGRPFSYSLARPKTATFSHTHTFCNLSIFCEHPI